MNYKNFFNWLEQIYRLEINKELQNTLTEHFGDNLNIYTDQDLYEQSRKIIQKYKEDQYLQITNKKYLFEE